MFEKHNTNKLIWKEQNRLEEWDKVSCHFQTFVKIRIICLPWKENTLTCFGNRTKQPWEEYRICFNWQQGGYTNEKLSSLLRTGELKDIQNGHEIWRPL